MDDNSLKVQLPVSSGKAKLSIPKDITQAELKIFYESMHDLLNRLAELNPELNPDEKTLTAPETDNDTGTQVVVSGEEVGGFVTSTDDSRHEIATKAGLFLRNYREKRAFQRTEIAENTGMSYSSVFNLEKGSSVPSLETLARFAAVYGCDVKITFVKNDHYDEIRDRR